MNDNGAMRDAPIRVLGIGGSTRQGSKSLVLLNCALREIEEAGAEVTLADVRALDLPIYDDDRPLENYPASLHELLASARAADAFVFCSPTYHGTVSGAVKNALDFIQFLSTDSPSFLYGKTIGMIATGAGAIAAVNAVTHLNQIAHALRAQVVSLAVPITGIGRAVVDDALVDEQARQRLDMLTKELVLLAGKRER